MQKIYSISGWASRAADKCKWFVSTRRLGLLAGAGGVGLALLLAFLSVAWLLRGRRGEDLDSRFPPGVLADYLPEDSTAVLAVNVRQLLQSPFGRQHLGPCLQQLIGQAEQELPWLVPTGIKPNDDIDTLLISFAPGDGGGPLGLARGRFDRSRLQIGPHSLQEKSLDRFPLWEYSDRAEKRTTLLAFVGDTLVVSQTPSRVQAALEHASNPQPVRVREAALRELLTKVDRRQTLWLAASITSLGPVSGIDDYLLKLLLRLLLAHAESVYGEISCTEDLRAEFHFGTATDEDAAQLETDLKSVRDVAREAPVFLVRQKELLPLVRLLGAGQIRRDGKTLLLRCRLTAEQLEKRNP